MRTYIKDKNIFLVLFMVAASAGACAQEKMPGGLKVSGYIQVQGQWGQEDASLKVGGPNTSTGESFGRLGIRRGRLKLKYTMNIASAVFQLDMTEKGVGIRDAYLNLNGDGRVAFTAGLFNRPFGYEIEYSSSSRESVERSTVFQTLFPGERDLGAMVTLQTRSKAVKLDAGLFAGGGVAHENDDRGDFIGHLSAAGQFGLVSLGGGVSYYNGAADRQYFGADVQFCVGKTKLDAEFLAGEHLGSRFTGGYATAVQGVGKIPLALAAKFDWFDLREGDNINTFGFGALWNFTSSLRLTAWYDLVSRARSNVFTLRLQYKF